MTSFESGSEHERFDELCAWATAGILTPAQSESLTLHLEKCAQCKKAFAEYRYIATEGMPSLADHFASNSGVDTFDESSALQRLMRSTDAVESQPARRALVASKKRIWNYSWVRGVAAAILLMAVGTEAYRTGAHSASAHVQNVSTNLRPALDRATEEKQGLERTLRAVNRGILALEQQVTADQNDLVKFRAQANDSAERAAELAEELTAAKRDANEQLAAPVQERDADANKVHDAEKMYQNVQDELNTLKSQHQQDLLRTASLETRVNSLNAEFNDLS